MEYYHKYRLFEVSNMDTIERGVLPDRTNASGRHDDHDPEKAGGSPKETTQYCAKGMFCRLHSLPELEI